jgi:hypothetical protein
MWDSVLKIASCSGFKTCSRHIPYDLYCNLQLHILICLDENRVNNSLREKYGKETFISFGDVDFL